MITQSQIKEILHYNPDNGVFTWLERPAYWFKSDEDSKKWNGRWAGSTAGSTRRQSSSDTTARTLIKILSRTYKAHRLAFLYMTGAFPSFHVDHINGDGADNRWCNLRDVMSAENCKNLPQKKNNTSGTTGVYWHRRKNQWQVCIRVDNILRHGGYFDEYSDAVEFRLLLQEGYGFHANHGRKQKGA